MRWRAGRWSRRLPRTLRLFVRVFSTRCKVPQACLVGVLDDRTEEGPGAHGVLLGLAGVEADDEQVLILAAGAIEAGNNALPRSCGACVLFG